MNERPSESSWPLEGLVLCLVKALPRGWWVLKASEVLLLPLVPDPILS